MSSKSSAKYKETEETKTVYIAKDLEEGDYFIITLPSKKALILRYSVASRSFNLSLVGVGGLIDREPFLRIGEDQMEDLDGDPSRYEYHRISFPSSLLPKVKERLKDLPNPFYEKVVSLEGATFS